MGELERICSRIDRVLLPAARHPASNPEEELLFEVMSVFLAVSNSFKYERHTENWIYTRCRTPSVLYKIG